MALNRTVCGDRPAITWAMVFFLMAYASVKCHQRQEIDRNCYEQTAAALSGCRHRPRPHQGKSHGRRHNIDWLRGIESLQRCPQESARCQGQVSIEPRKICPPKILRICSQALAAMRQGR